MPSDDSDLLARASAFSAFWARPLLRARFARSYLALAVLLICAARAYLQLIGTQLYSHDAFPLLDGAWRMLNGQRPHVDFYTGLGTLAYIPTLVGLLITQGNVAGFGAGQALTGLALATWAFLLARNRLTNFSTVLITLGLVLQATAPFGLGNFPMLMSPDCTYTRYGYVIVSMILIEAFCKDDGSSEFLGGCSTGIALILLLFLKISFFMGGGVIVIGFLWCRNQTRARWMGLAAGSVAAFLPLAVYFDFNLTPMIRDLMLVAGAKHVDTRWYQVDQTFALSVAVLTFASLAAAFAKASWVSIRVASAVTVVVGIFFLWTSHEPTGFPLVAPIVILIADRVVRSNAAVGPKAVLLAWGAAMILGSTGSDGIGFATILAQKMWISSSHWQLKHRERFASPLLSGFVPVGNHLTYLDLVNDGLSLVNRYRTSTDTIMSLDFANPFPYALASKPARGGTTSLQFGISFDDRHKPAPEWLIGNSSLVMVPKVASDVGLEVAIQRNYGPYLASHFYRIGESAGWLLYRANQT